MAVTEFSAEREAQLRELIRDANGATKDLRQATRQAREERAAFAQAVRRDRAEFEAAVTEGLEKFGDGALAQIDHARDTINKAIADGIEQLVRMGTGRPGAELIAALIEQAARVIAYEVVSDTAHPLRLALSEHVTALLEQPAPEAGG